MCGPTSRTGSCAWVITPPILSLFTLSRYTRSRRGKEATCERSSPRLAPMLALVKAGLFPYNDRAEERSQIRSAEVVLPAKDPARLLRNAMKLKCSDLWRWNGEMTRAPFFLWATFLFAVKYNLDRLALKIFF